MCYRIPRDLLRSYSIVKKSLTFKTIRNKMNTVASSDVLYPFDAAKFIAANSVDVAIRPEGIENISKVILEGLQKQDFELSDWKKLEVNPKIADNSAVDWIFFVDLLNFSFWADDNGQYNVSFNNKSYTGYFSLCAAVQKAIANGIPITDPKFYATVSKEQLKDILRSDSGADVPLLDERHRVLVESGKILINKFNGSFVNCLKLCNGSAQVLMKSVVENFPSFRDEAVYAGNRVAFYKRAQILIADIWACFENKGLGAFTDIDTVTMFADYRVPQVLAYFGALQYSEKLLDILRQKKIMINGSTEEVEIRGCSIWAVELIKKNIEQLVMEHPELSPKLAINSSMIDFFLWEYRRKHAAKIEEIPFHRMQFMLLFSRQGKLRLQKWYVAHPDKLKKKITRELITTVLARKPKMCSFLEWRDVKVVYKRYASLYFCCAIEQWDNELLTLEIIHRYVELLDKYFGSVCELDIIFNFEKAYFMLDELMLGGEIQETSKKSVLKAIAAQDLLQEEETPQGFFEDHGLG